MYVCTSPTSFLVPSPLGPSNLGVLFVWLMGVNSLHSQWNHFSPLNLERTSFCTFLRHLGHSRLRGPSPCTPGGHRRFQQWTTSGTKGTHSWPGVCLNHSLLIFKILFIEPAKVLKSYPTLCDPMDCSPPGSPIPGILQARTLEWVAISFSNAWKWKVKVKLLSRVWLSDPMDCSHQAPLSMGFSRQEYWSGVPLPSPVLY